MNRNSAFEIARQLNQQEQQSQARSILNAYRQVEQVRLPPQSQPKQASSTKPKLVSEYAAKIKETLKEINASKAKEIAALQPQVIKAPYKQQRQLSIDTLQLKRNATQKIYTTLRHSLLKGLLDLVEAMQMITRAEEERQRRTIERWQLKRIVGGWREEVIICNIERSREAEAKRTKVREAARIAVEFNNFHMLRKVYGGWRRATLQEKKRKELEIEMRRSEIRKERKTPPKTTDHQLQSKLRGFLDGLKDKIEGNRDRLKTIKQKTEESEQKVCQESQMREQMEIIQEGNEVLGGETEMLEEKEGTEMLEDRGDEGTEKGEIRKQYKKSLTNDELQERRRRLQQKYRSRQEALEGLKKQKREKKLEEEERRLEIEKQLQAEQKKIKQEQYRAYVRAKQIQEEWEIKLKRLQQQAHDFNRRRQMKYFGWNALKQAPKNTAHNCQQLWLQLEHVALTLQGEDFLRRIEAINEAALQRRFAVARKVRENHLLRKMLPAFKENYRLQLQQNAELQARVELKMLKNSLFGWKSILSAIRVENIEWERPRTKRAEAFRRINLLGQGLRSLQLNKHEQTQLRSLEAHRNNIKQVIKGIFDDADAEPDYTQFL